MPNPHAALFELDPLLNALVRKAPVIALSSTPRPVYDSLVSSIISQQLSVKAAATIKARFLALFPNQWPDPKVVLSLPTEVMREVGLSRQKISYLQNLATHKADGKLEDTQLETLPDEDLISQVTQIKGIGRWTAEMVLMFALHRPDVMPLDDVGIYNAMKRLYQIEEPLKNAKSRMLTLSQAWRPHRTLACRYLWQSLDNLPA